jgi:hypothetical protein
MGCSGAWSGVVMTHHASSLYAVLVAAGLTYCVANREQAKTEGYPVEEMQKMFMKLA